ncbi:LytR/AlgR family response regulator transcription factor [Polaribacter porphyrae]|uniref:HTH LytTR-type domain-containing protein n=1 Tax=Polaribacter porphyrae TaxID=1137780 RepID=A0A2S7WK51_9FLAO|nr:LytTR family DNA-binding domain-containing protein [Polaribacter porphyrae]PQJ77980.1 hypothetical protein BTO18_01715 [Polaribacter porphyrae]
MSTFFKSMILKLEFWIHLLFWTLFFASINVEWTQSWISNEFLPLSVAPHIALAVPILFFSNVFWLIPKFLNKKKWHLYLAISFSLFVGFEVMRSFIFSIYLSESDFSFAIFQQEFFGENSIIFGVLSMLIYSTILYSFLYRFAKDCIKNQSVINQLKFENANLQLSLANISVNEFVEHQPEKRTTFSIKKRDGFFLLRIEDIQYFQANGDFVVAVDNTNRKHIINERLSKIYSELDKKVFFQISRSEIVNFNYIKKYSSYIKNRVEVHLNNTEETLFTTNSRTPEFRVWLER